MALRVDRLDSGDLRLTIGNAFLPEDAWRIHELVEGTRSGARVALDFRNVRDCHDFALSLLARDVLDGRVAVDLEGMTQHQERVLSYFGVAGRGERSVTADLDPM